jgi:hypothetical protein
VSLELVLKTHAQSAAGGLESDCPTIEEGGHGDLSDHRDRRDT